MPIRHEMRHLYPPLKEWRAIRARILARAGDRCETCRAPNRTPIVRGTAGDAGTYMLQDGKVYDAETGEYRGLARGSEYEFSKALVVVLTIAHLDHDPTNNADDNLRALCQMHHLRHDAKEHAKNAAATRARKRDEATGQRGMFGGGA